MNFRFPVNLDVVTVHNFDAVEARTYFIVCVPTLYGRMYPRLLSCPDHHHFDPQHIDGCISDFHHDPQEPVAAASYETLVHHEPLAHHEHVHQDHTSYHPLPSYPLPPPRYGNPDPRIHHIGEPL